jgi:hypothetical protein
MLGRPPCSLCSQDKSKQQPFLWSTGDRLNLAALPTLPPPGPIPGDSGGFERLLANPFIPFSWARCPKPLEPSGESFPAMV